MNLDNPTPVVHIEYPAWVQDVVDWNRLYRTDEDRMRLAIAVARENVERGWPHVWPANPAGGSYRTRLAASAPGVSANAVTSAVTTNFGRMTLPISCGRAATCRAGRP